MSREEDGFLSRWSARKRAAREEAERPPEAEPLESAHPQDAPPDVPTLTEAEAAELTDAEALERLALPDPATLEHGADFRAFLRAGVPKRLQRLALRRLWAVSPGGAALDGLVDYAEDFTDAAVAVERIADSYEVGKGLRAHVEALARKAEAEEAGEAAEDDRETPAPSEDESAPRIADENAQEENAEPVSEMAVRHTAPAPVKARKMAFRFEDDAN
jgi:hypothetical protein